MTYTVEGFDMVGKSTFMNKMKFCETFHYDHDLTDKVAGRDNSWIAGYAIVDFIKQVKINNIGLQDFAINRHIMSSYVYEKLYNNHDLDPRIIEYYANNKFFRKEMKHIYICHQSKETARKIYEASQHREKNPNDLSHKYDTFSSFEEYWETYLKAHELFKEIYRKLGIAPKVYFNDFERGFIEGEF